MNGKQGLTAEEIDGSLLAMALVEAALRGDHEALHILFEEAKRTPEGVLPALVSNLSQVMRRFMGEDAMKQAQHWRKRIMAEKPVVR